MRKRIPSADEANPDLGRQMAGFEELVRSRSPPEDPEYPTSPLPLPGGTGVARIGTWRADHPPSFIT